MTGIFKKIVVFALICTMLFTLGLQAFALPINVDVNDNYYYTYYGSATEAPVAYNATKVLSKADTFANAATFVPVDLYARGEYLYVVDEGSSSVFVLDTEFRVVSRIQSLQGENIPELNKYIKNSDGTVTLDPELGSASQFVLNKPQGIYVDEEGMLYICDTQNRRIVVCDMYGVVRDVFQDVKSNVLGANYTFKPMKIVVDATGGMQVIAYAVNRGLMELDTDGSFRSFMGAPAVSYSVTDWFWRMIATDEQRKQLVKYVPTEYNNITSDSRNFIYATVGTISYADMLAHISAKSSSNAPIRKLSADGTDVLKRKGNYSPAGDLTFVLDYQSQIVDVAVDDESGRYTLLDYRMGRFFTYDPNGNLLYVGGGKGSQFGRLVSPSSIAIRGDQIIISDTGTNSLVVFESTDYAKAINEAVDASSNGLYDEAIGLWTNVLKYNSNMYIAYINMGIAEYRLGMEIYSEESLPYYERAIENFEAANEKENYSKAFKRLQNEKMQDNFTWIALGFLVIVLGCFALYIVHVLKKKKKERGGRG